MTRRAFNGKLDLARRQSETKRLIGLRLRAAREVLGFDQVRGKTQANFYRMFPTCGSKGRGNNWERGVAYPNPDFLIELYERFGVTTDWVLLGLSGDMPDRIATAIVENFRRIKDVDAR